MFSVSCSNDKRKESPLKVPKREIFDRSDFPDFYTIKSLRVGEWATSGLK